MGELTDADHAFLEMDERAATTRSPVETIGIVVAGMHRSGTSAVVRVLNLLGVDLPKELHATRPDNPLGYWEPAQVVEAHDEFLTAIGSSFDDVFSLPDEALRGEPARALEDRIVQILEAEFAGSRQFVVKDPRLCRLVPIWIAALVRFGASPRFVLPVRNPLEVAASLKLRNEYSTTKSLVLWLRHVLEAERHTRGLQRSIITYDQLLRDWQQTVETIARDLRFVWPSSSHSAQAEIEQFLSPRRRHHVFGLDELRARADVVDWVKATYELFVAAADGEQLAVDVLDALRGELDRADRAFGPLLAELRLSQRSQEQALSEQAAELTERAASLASVSAAAEARGRELDERTRELAGAGAEAERLTLELAQREEKLDAVTAEVSVSHEAVQRIELKLTDRDRALGETRAEIDRLTLELAQREEALAEQKQTLDETRAEVERLTPELARREEELNAATAEAAVSREAIGQTRTDVERLTMELARGEEERATAAASIRRLEERVQEVVDEAAGQAAQAQRTLNETAGVRSELATRDGRLATTRAALAETRRQRRRLARELARRVDAVTTLTATVDSFERAAAAHGAEAETLRRNILELEGREQSTAALLQDARVELARARSDRDTASADIDRLVRALADRETALAERIEAARSDAETISSLESSVAELERRRFLLRLRRSSRPSPSEPIAATRGPWKTTSPRSRSRSATQFLSWLARPRSGGWGFIATYFALRRSGEFDADAYLAHYHDVRDDGIDPLMHYVEHGRREGRSPFVVRPADVAATPNSADEEPPEAVATTQPSPPVDVPHPAVSVGHAPAAATTRTRGVDFSDFVVLLARQRSGTNPLRWLLTAHKDITCFSEIFSVLDRDSDDRDFEDRSYRDVNFLNFAAAKEPNWAQPGVADHRELFLDFLEYLRCFSDKRYAVLDIKYNTTHLLAEAWAHNLGSPLLFDLIVEKNMKVINVTRKNHLRFLLSNQKALQSGDWHVWGARAAAYHDRPVRLDCSGLLDELQIRADEDAVISRRFEGYPRYLALEYTDLFGGDGKLSPAFRRSLTDFLGIPDEWEPNQADGSHSQIFRRQSSLPLADAIENYEEVAATLSGTEFEWFLSDEPGYRTS